MDGVQDSLLSYTFEVVEANPEQGAVLALFKIEGHDEPIPAAVPFESGDHLCSELLEIRAHHVVEQIVRTLRDKAKAEARVYNGDWNALVGLKGGDEVDIFAELAPRPPKVDYHPIKETIVLSKPAKNRMYSEYEVVPREPEDAERQLLAFRRDYGCSPGQLRVALHRGGNLDQIEDAIKSADKELEIEWSFANSIKRTGGIASLIQRELGLSDEELDELFIVAQRKTNVDVRMGR